MGCRGKRSVDLAFVAECPFVAMVVRRRIVQGYALGRIAHIGHGVQHLVVHHHGFGRVARLLLGLGNDHGQLVAHVAHFAQCQHRVRRLFHGRAVRVVDQPAAGQAAHLAFQVGADKNLDHAGHGVRSTEVNAFDHRMGMWAAHKHGVALRSHGDVVGVLASTGQEAIVFLAANRFADMREFGEVGSTHVCTPYLVAAIAAWPCCTDLMMFW